METSRPSRTNADRTASSAGSADRGSGAGAASAAARAAAPKCSARRASACWSRCTRPARASRRAARATSLSARPEASATSSIVPAPRASAATTLSRAGSASSPTIVAASTPRPYRRIPGPAPGYPVPMASPIDIQKALSGMDYPATKDQILEHAQKNGADQEVVEALKKIEDREYEGPSGVSKAVFD